jgi:thiol-disulfide isomerase/thioredoxin
MRTFETHDDFESYWNGNAVPTKPIGVRKDDNAFLVYFTASWCGPCKRLDLDEIEYAAKAVGLPLWKVEQTNNSVSAGFCDVTSLPTFIMFKPKNIVSRFTNANTEKIVAWIREFELKKN